MLLSLKKIEKQTYNNIEVIVSDDNSSDNTTEEVLKIQSLYRFPLIYKKNEQNVGYDKNLRLSMMNASGDYCFILGNDDTLVSDSDIQYLVDFLQQNNFPDVGFCNYKEDTNRYVFERASTTGVIGSGAKTALKYYRSFSFVAGLVYKKEAFDRVNTAEFDGSIYVQMYLATAIMLSGGMFFMIQKPLVLKDITVPGKTVNSYRDVLARRWSDYREEDGGLPSVINVVCKAFAFQQQYNHKIAFKIIKDIYLYTFPYWILDYKKNGAFVHAIGLINGLKPWKIQQYSNDLKSIEKLWILVLYYTVSGLAVLFPARLFFRLKPAIYQMIKKA